MHADHLVQPQRLTDMAVALDHLRTELARDAGVLTVSQLNALQEAAQACRGAALVRGRSWPRARALGQAGRPPLEPSLN